MECRLCARKQLDLPENGLIYYPNFYPKQLL